MTRNECAELAGLLEALLDIDRLATCSDRFFRQVYTQKVKVIAANKFVEKLRGMAEEKE